MSTADQARDQQAGGSGGMGPAASEVALDS